MRWILLTALLVSTLLVASSVGILAGKEMGGRERMYVGVSAMLGDSFGLGVDVYKTVASFESIGEELSEIDLIEVDPGIFLALRLEDLKIYAFVSPMVILNTSDFSYSLYPIDTLRAKIGAKFKVGTFSIFVEGLTSFIYKPSFATSGIYSFQGGLAVGF